MSLQRVTPELKAKALACETPEEMLALAKEEGYELSDEQLDSIAGGMDWGFSQDYYYVTCAACKSKVSWKVEDPQPVNCPDCGAELLILG